MRKRQPQEPSRKNADNTRGRPFERGNPGRPKGARNKATVLAEQLLEADVEAVAKAVVREAKRGNMVAAKLVLDRVAPPRRGRAIEFDLPSGTDPVGMVAAFSALTNSVASGAISPEEAAAVASVLELQRKAIETQELLRRVVALEAARGDAE